MNFFQAVKRCLIEKYCCFSGRASRSEYWHFNLFFMLLSVVLGILFSAFILVFFNLLDTQSEFAMIYFWLLFAIMGMLVVGILLLSWSVGVRRLHDIGKSGWWLLVGSIPYIGRLVSLYWDIKPSEQGTNRFGPQPPETME